MPSYIAAFALQQLKDMEQLQRDSRAARARRRRRRELRASAAVQESTPLWTAPHETRRAHGVSASTKGATGTSTVS